MASLIAPLGLLGFFFGAILYTFLLWVVLQRTERRSLERGLILLIGSLLIWYTGSFVSLLLRQMDMTRLQVPLGIVDSVSFACLALLPALLAHTHWLYFKRKFPASVGERRLAKSILVFLYATLFALPAALAKLFPGNGIHPMQKVAGLTFPFLVVLGVSYFFSCYLEFRILQQSKDPVERAVFTRLLPLFLLVPFFNFYAFWPSGYQPADDPWAVSASLTSVLPSIVVVYYIYHYKFLHLVIHRGISTILLLLFTLAVYLVGIRRLVGYLETEYQAPSLLFEAIFLAALLVLFPIMTRWLSRYTEGFFSGQLSRHRKLAESISLRGPHQLDTRLLTGFMEETLQRELPAEEVRISIDSEIIETGPGLLLPLSTPSGVLGSLRVVSPGVQNDPAQREALGLIANEVALALERNRLVQSKVTLEKRLAARSHMEEIGRMAANVAHTVKNPLSSMKTLMQLLLEGNNLDREQRDDIEMMITEIDRLARTTTSLLKYSKEESEPALEGAMQEVDLEHLLNSVQSVFSGDLKRRSVRLETSLAIHPGIIRSDADGLSDILGNLISNALEVTPPGGTIQVELAEAGPDIQIVVTDSGPGIPAELKDRIFEPFLTTKPRGTGLGLAIVKKRVSQLFGTIRLETPLTDHGTRFTITLPRVEARGAAAVPGAEETDSPAKNKQSSPRH